MAPLRTCHSNCPQALPTSTSHRQFPLAQAPPIDTSQSHGRCSLAPTLAYPSIMSLIASQRYFAIGLLLLLPLPHTHPPPPLAPFVRNTNFPTHSRNRNRKQNDSTEIKTKYSRKEHQQNLAGHGWPCPTKRDYTKARRAKVKRDGPRPILAAKGPCFYHPVPSLTTLPPYHTTPFSFSFSFSFLSHHYHSASFFFCPPYYHHNTTAHYTLLYDVLINASIMSDSPKIQLRPAFFQLQKYIKEGEHIVMKNG